MHPNNSLLLDNIKNLTSCKNLLDNKGKGVYDCYQSVEEVMADLPDLIQELEEKKAYYTDQLKKVNKALMALRDDGPVSDSVSVSSTQRGKRIQWTREIRAIFNLYPDTTFSPADLKELLREKGLPIDDTGNKNAIYTTLSRLCEKGRIEKLDDGLYKKKKRQPIPLMPK